MRSPKLEINAAGNKYLVVWYCPGNRDYTKIIKDAFEFHKISEEEARTMPVVVVPVKKRAIR